MHVVASAGFDDFHLARRAVLDRRSPLPPLSFSPALLLLHDPPHTRVLLFGEILPHESPNVFVLTLLQLPARCIVLLHQTLPLPRVCALARPVCLIAAEEAEDMTLRALNMRGGAMLVEELRRPHGVCAIDGRTPFDGFLVDEIVDQPLAVDGEYLCVCDVCNAERGREEEGLHGEVIHDDVALLAFSPFHRGIASALDLLFPRSHLRLNVVAPAIVAERVLAVRHHCHASLHVIAGEVRKADLACDSVLRELVGAVARPL
mmetsp:Transcript_57374/g.117460  ORF Transcript_57374/g.117460 Transcript_57374/m.117460 type:complete len:261 (-) Transcript_57374:470-1252(-)